MALYWIAVVVGLFVACFITAIGIQAEQNGLVVVLTGLTIGLIIWMLGVGLYCIVLGHFPWPLRKFFPLKSAK
jgi:hypothetical protein